ncbi:hypothetical protein OTK49_20755 [Vibrio coralliirubri]|uniref:hypothetical protein n=1 Tax=Vibrio coralliirubri TaxID=1516159 RepID=UPI0022852B47|nr:hypothetical protein [Vibrio coralliirubri]MCY9864949.1 hypothetical protein [Vibrio coralliirubri]
MTNQVEQNNVIVLLDHRFGWDEDYTEDLLRDLLDKRSVEYVSEPTFNPLTSREQMFVPETGVELGNGAFGYMKMHLIGSEKWLHLEDEWVVSAESIEDNTVMLQDFELSSEIMPQIAKFINGGEYSECKTEADYVCELTIPLSFFDFIQSKEAFLGFMYDCEWTTPEHIEEMKAKYSF